jgi:hypothetical protein
MDSSVVQVLSTWGLPSACFRCSARLPWPAFLLLGSTAAVCPEGGGHAWAGARWREGISSTNAAGTGQAARDGGRCRPVGACRAELVDVGVDEVVVAVGYRANGRRPFPCVCCRALKPNGLSGRLARHAEVPHPPRLDQVLDRSRHFFDHWSRGRSCVRSTSAGVSSAKQCGYGPWPRSSTRIGNRSRSISSTTSSDGSRSA